MRKALLTFVASLSLAGCEPTVSTLFMPMEPTRASIGAKRRDLTSAEKELISEAVSPKLKGSIPRDFKWAPLVLASRDRVYDYCGLVNGSDVDGNYTGYSKFMAQLTFATDGALSKVEVRSLAKSRAAYPTDLDSQCIQEGYGGLPVIAEARK